jgi:uncharacterized membrane protein
MTRTKHTSNGYDGFKLTMVGLRDYLESLLEAKDRLQEERDKLIDVRFNAIKDGTVVAFAAAEKASAKTEQAQAQYNIAHNDLLHRMDKQAEEFLTRHEHAQANETLRQEIIALREFKIAVNTKDTQVVVQHTQKQWTIGNLVAIIAVIAAWLAVIMQHFVH